MPDPASTNDAPSRVDTPLDPTGEIRVVTDGHPPQDFGRVAGETLGLGELQELASTPGNDVETYAKAAEIAEKSMDNLATDLASARTHIGSLQSGYNREKAHAQRMREDRDQLHKTVRLLTETNRQQTEYVRTVSAERDGLLRKLEFIDDVLGRHFPEPYRGTRGVRWLSERYDGAQEELEDAGKETDELRRTIQAVRELHYEFEGRCVACVTWCDCDADLVDRHQHNVVWPCPTAKALEPIIASGATT